MSKLGEALLGYAQLLDIMTYLGFCRRDLNGQLPGQAVATAKALAGRYPTSATLPSIIGQEWVKHGPSLFTIPKETSRHSSDTDPPEPVVPHKTRPLCRPEDLPAEAPPVDVAAPGPWSVVYPGDQAKIHVQRFETRDAAVDWVRQNDDDDGNNARPLFDLKCDTVYLLDGLHNLSYVPAYVRLSPLERAQKLLKAVRAGYDKCEHMNCAGDSGQALDDAMAAILNYLEVTAEPG